MKLLIFSPYYPPHRGGLETHSDEFNKHFSKRDVAITVFTPHFPLESSLEETLHKNVSIIRFPAIELIHNYPIPAFWEKSFWILWKKIKQSSPEIIISRTRFFFPSLMAGYLAWKKNLPWVHIEHGSDFAQFENLYKNILSQWYDYTFGRFVLRQAKVLIANSQASQQFVQKLSGRTDCHIIYRGIEKELIQNALPILDIRERHPHKILIGYIGRLIEGKGVKDLIQAFASSNYQASHLIIIGDGPERKNLEIKVSALKLTPYVTFLGALPLPIAMGHLKTWDIFVNPSYTEGIPTSVIEAALLKKAIIATNVGGTDEIITGIDDGILVQPRDVVSLKDALLKLQAKKSLLESYGQNAEKRVSGLFVWEKAIDSYQTLFAKILS